MGAEEERPSSDASVKRQGGWEVGGRGSPYSCTCSRYMHARVIGILAPSHPCIHVCQPHVLVFWYSRVPSLHVGWLALWPIGGQKAGFRRPDWPTYVPVHFFPFFFW